MAELQSEPRVKKATGDPRMTMLSTTSDRISNFAKGLAHQQDLLEAPRVTVIAFKGMSQPNDTLAG
jgi:hypothetical protein